MSIGAVYIKSETREKKDTNFGGGRGVINLGVAEGEMESGCH